MHNKADVLLVASMDTVVVLKQLSKSNWKVEKDTSVDALRKEFDNRFEICVRDYPAGKNNKNKNSGKTLVAIFSESPSNELIANMRWCVHTRFG